MLSSFAMIEGKTLQLRTVKTSDLAELYFFLDSIRFKGEYLPSDLLSEERFRKTFFETGFWEEERGTFLIEAEEKVLGAIWFESLLNMEGFGVTFYIFRPEDRGKGWMSEALFLACKHLFFVKRIERIQSLVPNYSKGAIRTLQKCGFQFEGILRKGLFQGGEWIDLCLYSLLRADL